MNRNGSNISFLAFPKNKNKTISVITKEEKKTKLPAASTSSRTFATVSDNLVFFA